MKTVTLEEIENKQTELSQLIAKFKSEQPRALLIQNVTIDLAEGEHYAGIILDEEGNPSHHLILLPGDRVDINWKDATAWANSIEGSLPTRPEQALLYANLKGQFERTWYWSSQGHASDCDYAWSQHFSLGEQIGSRTNTELRARAVRRICIF